MTDTEFLAAFEAGRLPTFHHRDHLRLAWLRVRQLGGGAEEAVAADIRGFAARAGAGRKYHETMTVFWVRLVRHADAVHNPVRFDELIEACPLLLEQGAPGRHWRPELLWSEEARAGWIEPDLRPMPVG